VRNFYNRKQADIVSGAANMAAILVADGAGMGVSPTQISGFGAFNTVLQSSWTTSVTPETRTPVSIEATRIAIKNMRENAIALNALIRANPAVTDAQLIGLGLLPRTTRTPRPAEMTAPSVEVESVVGRLVKLNIRQAGAEKRARPIGSAGALVYSFIGPAAPSDPSAYKFEGLASKGNEVEVLFPDDTASGATAWISAAWVSQRGQRGFASTPVQVTIQGGPVLAAEGA
jgi:hypothetical protein